MPTATGRTRRTRRSSSRSTSSRKTAEETREASPQAAAEAGAEKPAGSTKRTTHRGSRGGRGRRRPATSSAATEAPEKPSAATSTESPATGRTEAETPKRRATHRGSRGGRGRKRSSAATRGETKTTAGEAAVSAPAAPETRKKTTRRTSTRTRKKQAETETRAPSQATTPRARVPVTGAPSEEVPAPFAHNAEYEFARILDFYGIEWQYEPRSFPLRYDRGHVSEAFKPDFYLPDLNLYVELTTVKPNLTQEKNRKMRLLKELYPEVNVMLLKKRDYLRLLAKYGYGPLKPDQVPEVGKVLFSATKIQRRVGELGAQISHDYADTEPVLVGVLRGVMCFMADLMRNVSIATSVDFMAISSYEGNGAAAVRILKDLDENIKGKDVILVEDIVDTGMTLNHVVEYLQTKKPRSVKVCTLLDKRARRLVNVPLEYVGFEVPDAFVVGYGLDFRQRYRNLPFIATLKHELLP